MNPTDNFDWLLDSHGLDGDAEHVFALGRELKQAGQLELAATAFDRAYGLDPSSTKIQEYRDMVLDELAVEEHGIQFRYIPAGTFLMGSEDGDHDEKPVHPVKVDSFRLSETPITWAKCCELLGFNEPPDCAPEDFWDNYRPNLPTNWLRHMMVMIKVRRRFSIHRLPDGQLDFDRKPVVATPYEAIGELCSRVSNDQVDYRLPTEAEWEKAARGGLINAKYAWGNQNPSISNCDFDHMNTFEIGDLRKYPPNGYGLYAMCGGVWEWTSDWYDAEYYRISDAENPPGPLDGQERVLRGGCWTDAAEAVTVSFRMSYKTERAFRYSTFGFRLCRKVIGP